jgi:hypothetical protein
VPVALFAPAAAAGEAKLSCAASCGEDWHRERDKLCQFPQILGGGGQQELVLGSGWATEAQSTKPENALEMSEASQPYFVLKKHRNLISFSTRDGVGLGLVIARALSRAAS